MSDNDIPLTNNKVLYTTLLKSDDYAVSQVTVRPGGQTQWHHHTDVRDRFLVVHGVLTVETKTADQVTRTEVSEHHAVEPHVLHHVRNDTSDDVVYIMVQSGGARDIVLA